MHSGQTSQILMHVMTYLLVLNIFISCGYKGDTAKVKLLYDCEADIEVSDYDFRTVGHLAGAEGHYELLEYLAMKTNYNFDLKDRWGTTCLNEIKDEAVKGHIKGHLEKRHKYTRRITSFSPIKQREKSDSDECLEGQKLA